MFYVIKHCESIFSCLKSLKLIKNHRVLAVSWPTASEGEGMRKDDLLAAIQGLSESEINELAEALAPLLAKVVDLLMWHSQEKRSRYGMHGNAFNRPSEMLFNALNDCKRR